MMIRLAVPPFARQLQSEAHAYEDPVFQNLAQFIAAGFKCVRVRPDTFEAPDFPKESFAIVQMFVSRISKRGCYVVGTHDGSLTGTAADFP